MQQITTDQQLRAAVDESREHPVVLFKHSTTCPISAAAYREVNAFFARQVAPVYLVRVIEDRPVAQSITAQFGIRHESPQVLVLRNQQVTWTASHRRVTVDALVEAVSAENTQ